MNTIFDTLLPNLIRMASEPSIHADDTVQPNGYECHDDKQATLYVDLPGCKRESIQIETEKNRVFIQAERKIGETVKKYAERYSFNMKYDVSRAEAKYDDGVLKLIVPSSIPEQPTKRKLEIG